MGEVNTITIFYSIDGVDGYSIFDANAYDLQDAINYVIELLPRAKLIDYKID